MPMKAVQLTGHGDMDQLAYRDDVPIPEPGRGEVRIKVHACGMNNTDVWVRKGAYGTSTDANATSTWQSGESTLVFPRIQGTDIVGHIDAVGDDVDDARMGERIMVNMSLYNRPEGDDSLADIDYIGHGRDGGYAEYTVVPSANAHATDAAITDAELATFCCAYLTGEQLLDRAHVAGGERIFVTGASGGVGSGLIQLARARGAIPYALTSSGKEDEILAIGAEATVLRDEEGNIVDKVHEATNNEPIDVVADLVGGPIFNDLLRLLRPEGRYTSSGAIAGPVVELDLRTMYLKQLELNGASQGTRGAFQRVLGHIESGRIRPLLARTYKLSEFKTAQQAFMDKNHIGNLVIVPDSLWDEYGAPHAE